MKTEYQREVLPEGVTEEEMAEYEKSTLEEIDWEDMKNLEEFSEHEKKMLRIHNRIMRNRQIETGEGIPFYVIPWKQKTVMMLPDSGFEKYAVLVFDAVFFGSKSGEAGWDEADSFIKKNLNNLVYEKYCEFWLPSSKLALILSQKIRAGKSIRNLTPDWLFKDEPV